MAENKTIDDGGPAFPVEVVDVDGSLVPIQTGHKTGYCAGLSIRDHFAGQIACGMAAFSGTSGVSYGPGEIAGRSYQIADAMIAARKGGAL